MNNIINKFYRSRLWIIVLSLSLFVGSLHAFDASMPTAFVDGIRYTVQLYDREDAIDIRRYGFERHVGYGVIAPDGHAFSNWNDYVYVTKQNRSYGHNTPWYEVSEDTMLLKPPYYEGDIYIPDSVYMPYGLSSYNVKRGYKLVLGFFGFGNSLFNEKLTSIRTPVYGTIGGVFDGCIGLRKAQIGASYRLGPSAFSGCTALDTVIFEHSPLIEDKAFEGCHNIRTIRMESAPPTFASPKLPPQSDPTTPVEPLKIFEPEVYAQATLYVPSDQLEAYRSAPYWKDFSRITTLDHYYTGLEGVIADSEVTYDVYTLSGMLVRRSVPDMDIRAGLPSGIYIIRGSDGTARKEYIR